MLIPAFLPELSAGGNSQNLAAATASPDDRFAIEDFIRHRLEAGSTALHAEALLELDRILLSTVLRFTNGNQYQAAKNLGMARQTLCLRLREIRISVTKAVEEEEAEGG